MERVHDVGVAYTRHAAVLIGTARCKACEQLACACIDALTSLPALPSVTVSCWVASVFFASVCNHILSTYIRAGLYSRPICEPATSALPHGCTSAFPLGRKSPEWRAVALPGWHLQHISCRSNCLGCHDLARHWLFGRRPRLRRWLHDQTCRVCRRRLLQTRARPRRGAQLHRRR